MNLIYYRGFGKTTLQEVLLQGLGDAHTKHAGQAEAKGTKAHFKMDDNGILTLDKVFLNHDAFVLSSGLTNTTDIRNVE